MKFLKSFQLFICIIIFGGCVPRYVQKVVTTPVTSDGKGLKATLVYLGSDSMLDTIRSNWRDSIPISGDTDVGLHFLLVLDNYRDSFVVLEVPDKWFSHIDYPFDFNTYNAELNLRTEYFRISQTDSLTHNLNYTYRKYILIPPRSRYVLSGSTYDKYNNVYFFENRKDTSIEVVGPLLTKAWNCGFNVEFSYAVFDKKKDIEMKEFKKNKAVFTTNTVFIDPKMHW